MIIKRLNPVRNFSKTGGYLGTTADGTPAHDNPKLRKFKVTGDPRLAIYQQRDLATFGPMDTSNGLKGLERQVRRIRRHHHTKNTAYQFTLSPDPDKDNLNPNNPKDIHDFMQYVTTWVNTNFKHNFAWYAVIQPDSSTGSHVHCHVIVINRNLQNDRSMTSNYYGLRHIRHSAHIAKIKFNKTHQRQFSDVQGYTRQHDYIRDYSKIRKPSKRMSYIIKHAKNINECKATTIKNMKKWLLNHGIEAKRYKTTKSHRHGKRKSVTGWRYRPVGDKGRFIKSSTIAQCKGGYILQARNLESIRHNNNVERGKKIHAEHKEASVSSSLVASSVSSSSASASVSVSINNYISNSTTTSASQSMSLVTFQRSNAVNKAYSATSNSYMNVINAIHRRYAPNSKWIPVINDYRNYEDVSTPSLTIGQAMPRFSNDKVRQSVSSVYGHVFQTTVINQHRGVQEFHIISNSLGYTDKDVSLFHRVMNPLIQAFHSASQKIRQWGYINWRKGKSAIKRYVNRHPQLLKAHRRPITKDHWEPGYDNHGIFTRNLSLKSKIVGYKTNRNPFHWSLSRLIPYRHKFHKSKTHFVYNRKVDKFNRDEYKKQRIIDTVNTLPKSISDRFSHLVAPIARVFNKKSATASSASSAMNKNKAASSNAMVNALQDRNNRINRIRKSSAEDSWAHTPNGSASITSSLASSSASASSVQASVSASSARWTSSVYALGYSGWSSAVYSANTVSSDYHTDFNTLFKLESIGSHKHRKYTGAYGYVTKAYENKDVNFNLYRSLTKSDREYAQHVSDSEAMARSHERGERGGRE